MFKSKFQNSNFLILLCQTSKIQIFKFPISDFQITKFQNLQLSILQISNFQIENSVNPDPLKQKKVQSIGVSLIKFLSGDTRFGFHDTGYSSRSNTPVITTLAKKLLSARFRLQGVEYETRYRLHDWPRSYGAWNVHNTLRYCSHGKESIC